MQQIIYDPNKNEVRTVIKKPFIMASEMLGWNRKSQGLGFNRQIINTCLENESDLIVFVESNDAWYQISFAQLKSFLEYYNCDYTVKGNTILKVIAFDEFKILES